jgi:DNA-binding FrmR family transcriptional regulator
MTTDAKCCSQCTPECDLDDCSRHTERDPKEIKALLNRCNRVEGQIRGVKGMLEKDAYCDDILHQIAAAQSALDSLSKVLLERHMRSCLISRIQAGEMEVVDELITTIGKLMK